MADSIKKNLDEKRKRVEELRRRREERAKAKAAGGAAPLPPAAGTATPPPAGAPSKPEETADDIMDMVQNLIGAPSAEPPEAAPAADADAANLALPPAAPASAGAAGLALGGPTLADRLARLTLCARVAELSVPPAPRERYDKQLQTDESYLETLAAERGGGGDGAGEGGGGAGGPGSPGPKPSRHRRMMSFKAGGKMSSAIDPASSGDQLGSPRGSLVSPRQLSESEAFPAVAEEPRPEGGGGGGGGGAEGGGDDGEGGEPGGCPAPGITEEERRKHMASEEFGAFLESTARTVERALGAGAVYDIFVDYARSDSGATVDRSGLTLTHTFKVPAEEGPRGVTDLHWSPAHPELLLAAYTPRGGALGGPGLLGGGGAEAVGGGGVSSPDGLVLVWSLALQGRPERRLTAQSPVLAARFSEADPHLIVGGTYGGQVVAWDTRLPHGRPARRSAAAGSARGGHAHPVYCLELTGGGGAAQTLVSASTDGVVCTWNPEQLAEPTDSFRLRSPNPPAGMEREAEMAEEGAAQEYPIAVSSFAVAGAGDSPGTPQAGKGTVAAAGYLAVGSESGAVYKSPLHLRAGAPAAGAVREYRAHFGLVTALDFNRAHARRAAAAGGRAAAGGNGGGALLLSAGVDWTTRLWRLGGGAGGQTEEKAEPLLTFQYQTHDYVADVKWSPAHPSLFATAAASGELALWDLGRPGGTEAPALPPVEVVHGGGGGRAAAGGGAGAAAPGGGGGGGGTTLNKLAWSTEGRRIAVGDGAGTAHVYTLSEELAAPRPDEDARLEAALRDRAGLFAAAAAAAAAPPPPAIDA